MTLDSVVQFCKDRKLKILLSIVLIVIVCLYLKVFFMTGIYYKDTFLKKEIVQEEIHYKSKGKHGDAEIIVKGKGRLDQNSKAEVISIFLTVSANNILFILMARIKAI